MRKLLCVVIILVLLNVKSASAQIIDGFLVELARCESRGNELAVNPRDPITESLGLYQYKLLTFKNFARQYKLIDWEMPDKEWRKWIFNGPFQTLLTKTVLTQDPQNYRHWKNCSKNIGLDDYANSLTSLTLR